MADHKHTKGLFIEASDGNIVAAEHALACVNALEGLNPEAVADVVEAAKKVAYYKGGATKHWIQVVFDLHEALSRLEEK